MADSKADTKKTRMPKPSKPLREHRAYARAKRAPRELNRAELGARACGCSRNSTDASRDERREPMAVSDITVTPIPNLFFAPANSCPDGDIAIVGGVDFTAWRSEENRHRGHRSRRGGAIEGHPCYQRRDQFRGRRFPHLRRRPRLHRRGHDGRGHDKWRRNPRGNDGEGVRCDYGHAQRQRRRQCQCRRPHPVRISTMARRWTIPPGSRATLAAQCGRHSATSATPWSPWAIAT